MYDFYCEKQNLNFSSYILIFRQRLTILLFVIAALLIFASISIGVYFGFKKIECKLNRQKNLSKFDLFILFPKSQQSTMLKTKFVQPIMNTMTFKVHQN